MKRKSLLLILYICFYLISGIATAQDKLYPNEFPLSDVKLLDGPFKHARDLNIEVLLKYDVDRLLAPYRKEAGLPEKAKCYPNWEGLDGHVGGHYLSAIAMNYANRKCRMQKTHGSHDLGAKSLSGCQCPEIS